MSTDPQSSASPTAQPAAVAPAAPPVTTVAYRHARAPEAKHGFFHLFGGFIKWIFTGFGLFARHSDTDMEQVVVYSVHRAFYLWLMILVGFVGAIFCGPGHESANVVWGWIYLWTLMFTILSMTFDLGTKKFLLWAGVFAFVWLISRYLKDLKNLTFLSDILGYIWGLSPGFNKDFAVIMSWLLMLPWIGALFQSFSRGRKVFSPNSIEEWYLGEGREVTDRSGLKFRSRYRDLLEMVLGFGAGDLEAIDSNQHVVKKWENVLFLAFNWDRLDKILHQRAAVVESEKNEPVEVVEVNRP